LMGEYNECLGPAAEQKLTVMVFLAVLFACSPGRYYPRLRVSSLFFLQFFSPLRPATIDAKRARLVRRLL